VLGDQVDAWWVAGAEVREMTGYGELHQLFVLLLHLDRIFR
jgi:hypothetical protein